jgi:membrane protein
MDSDGRVLCNWLVDPLPLRPFRWRNLAALFAGSAARWNAHNAPRLGAALAFYTLLSIAPLLIVVTAIASQVYGSQAARDEILDQVYAVAGSAGANVVGAILGRAENTQHGLLATILGSVVGLLGATGVVSELRDALNTMWDVPVPETDRLESVLNVIRDRLFAAALVLCAGFFLLLSLTANLLVSQLAAWGAGTSLLSFLVVTTLFAAILKFVPDLRIEWMEALLGAALTSLLFEIGRQLIALYLARANFGASYGAAASTTALLVWVYYSSQIFFFGAAFTKELEMRRSAGTE